MTQFQGKFRFERAHLSAAHIFLLHTPDFLGYEDAFEMAKDHRDVVERGLRLKIATGLMTRG
jgi:coenzyme F420-reducing hydrogenase alpha subunit